LRVDFVIESGIMRILIIRPGALGDTLMLAPALAEMKGRADIDLVARRPGLDILRPLVRTGMDYEGGAWYRLFMDDPLLVSNGSVHEPVDLAVAFLSDQSEKARENLKLLVPGSSVQVFPPFPRKGENVHTALYVAKCLESSGCAVNPEKAIQEAVQRPMIREEAFLVPGSKRRIVFHPGSGGASKNHPCEFWAALLRGFRHIVSKKAPLAVLLGPAEESCLSFYREQISGDETEIIFSPETEPLLRLLKSAPLYLGHDSGITHLAAMLGTPTVALFRTSNLEQWRPLGPRVEVIEEESSPDLVEKVCEKAREMVL
jgi:heptosyltransferase III